MPRSWHSSTEYFICRSTGLPQMSQISTRFLLITPHFWQLTVSSCGWSVMIFEPQFAQVMRRCSRPFSDPHLQDRKSTRLNSSHLVISYAVFCLKKKKNEEN